MDISVMPTASAGFHLKRLASILADSIEDGALVGFILPFGTDHAEAYWQGVFSAMAANERLLLCAMIDGDVVGTVQLYLSPEPNAPHRAEVFKLLVQRDFQSRGIATALMRAIEEEAARFQRSLLLLDTVQGGKAERLYRRLGWQEIGVVPNHFVDPFGNLNASVYFMKSVATFPSATFPSA